MNSLHLNHRPDDNISVNSQLVSKPQLEQTSLESSIQGTNKLGSEFLKECETKNGDQPKCELVLGHPPTKSLKLDLMSFDDFFEEDTVREEGLKIEEKGKQTEETGKKIEEAGANTEEAGIKIKNEGSDDKNKGIKNENLGVIVEKKGAVVEKKAVSTKNKESVKKVEIKQVLEDSSNILKNAGTIKKIGDKLIFVKVPELSDDAVKGFDFNKLGVVAGHAIFINPQAHPDLEEGDVIEDENGQQYTIQYLDEEQIQQFSKSIGKYIAERNLANQNMQTRPEAQEIEEKRKNPNETDLKNFDTNQANFKTVPKHYISISVENSPSAKLIQQLVLGQEQSQEKAKEVRHEKEKVEQAIDKEKDIQKSEIKKEVDHKDIENKELSDKASNNTVTMKIFYPVRFSPWNKNHSERIFLIATLTNRKINVVQNYN